MAPIFLDEYHRVPGTAASANRATDRLRRYSRLIGCTPCRINRVPGRREEYRNWIEPWRGTGVTLAGYFPREFLPNGFQQFGFDAEPTAVERAELKLVARQRAALEYHRQEVAQHAIALTTFANRAPQANDWMFPPLRPLQPPRAPIIPSSALPEASETRQAHLLRLFKESIDNFRASDINTGVVNPVPRPGSEPAQPSLRLKPAPAFYREGMPHHLSWVECRFDHIFVVPMMIDVPGEIERVMHRLVLISADGPPSPGYPVELFAIALFPLNEFPEYDRLLNCFERVHRRMFPDYELGYLVEVFPASWRQDIPADWWPAEDRAQAQTMIYFSGWMSELPFSVRNLDGFGWIPFSVFTLDWFCSLVSLNDISCYQGRILL